jgi:hypothetical protein
MLLGIDTLMDMGRTAMNVIGNCMAAAVVARWEGELKPPAISLTACVLYDSSMRSFVLFLSPRKEVQPQSVLLIATSHFSVAPSSATIWYPMTHAPGEGLRRTRGHA